MKKITPILFITFTLNYLFPHCQVPCGIYDDVARIVTIHEDIQTIQKSIKMINELSYGETSAKSMNQLVRWVNTKEDHAQHIQDVILNYFLAQRIKPKEKGEKEYKRYVSLTTTCQRIIFYAMKSKQNSDVSRLDPLKRQINTLSDTYFDDHGKQHLNDLMNK
tara:strand:+ start:36 stop:524 length:489 start_codon:yes stop_codon:yes gene_type:complete